MIIKTVFLFLLLFSTNNFGMNYSFLNINNDENLQLWQRLKDTYSYKQQEVTSFFSRGIIGEKWFLKNKHIIMYLYKQYRKNELGFCAHPLVIRIRKDSHITLCRIKEKHINKLKSTKTKNDIYYLKSIPLQLNDITIICNQKFPIVFQYKKHNRTLYSFFTIKN